MLVRRNLRSARRQWRLVLAGAGERGDHSLAIGAAGAAGTDAILTIICGLTLRNNLVFAVVATEARHLAQRSAGAAREIKALILDSVERIEAGAETVDVAGKTMNEIVDSVKRAAMIMSGISDSSMEQSAGIEQVNAAITQMDQITQQNAALVEQAAAAAETMKDQANGLAQLVNAFKLMSGSVMSQTEVNAQRERMGRTLNTVKLPPPARPEVRVLGRATR